MAVSMPFMKKATATPPKSKAREVVDLPFEKLRAAIRTVQVELDAMLEVVAEAERLGHKSIRCEPKSLLTSARFAAKVRESVDRRWRVMRPNPLK